jgi:hypothetical protein
MTKTEQKTLQTLDLYLSSYLSLCGISPKLEINNGRVVFVFPANDDLYKLMVNYNSNVNVPVTDFVTTIKTLRGQMLTMRKQR